MMIGWAVDLKCTYPFAGGSLADEERCVDFGLPNAAIQLGGDKVLPLEQLAAEVMKDDRRQI